MGLILTHYLRSDTLGAWDPILFQPWPGYGGFLAFSLLHFADWVLRVPRIWMKDSTRTFREDRFGRFHGGRMGGWEDGRMAVGSQKNTPQLQFSTKKGHEMKEFRGFHCTSIAVTGHFLLPRSKVCQPTDSMRSSNWLVDELMMGSL